MENQLVMTLGILISKSQPCPTSSAVQQPGQEHITMPTESIPNADTSVFWTHSSGPFHCTCILLQVNSVH